MKPPADISDETPERVDVRGAGGLVGSLRSPDLGVRLGALRAVANAPERALAYGAHDGEDVVDVLIEQLLGPGTLQVKEVLVEVLSRLSGPRTWDCFRVVMQTGDEVQTVRGAAAGLMRSDRPDDLSFLRAQLMRNDVDLQPTCAAMALKGRAGLQAQEALRVALLTGQREGNDLYFWGSLDSWLAELSGRFGGRARAG